jgi:hypothetical protein
MKQRLIKLRHWWQRNFGHVYASANGKDWHRFGARLGCIALVWVDSPFIVRLGEDHRLIITEKVLPGYGKPYGGWQWDYEPHGCFVGDGGAW